MCPFSYLTYFPISWGRKPNLFWSSFRIESFLSEPTKKINESHYIFIWKYFYYLKKKKYPDIYRAIQLFVILIKSINTQKKSFLLVVELTYFQDFNSLDFIVLPFIENQVKEAWSFHSTILVSCQMIHIKTTSVKKENASPRKQWMW